MVGAKLSKLSNLVEIRRVNLMLHMSQLVDHPSIVNGDITGCTPLSWNAASEALPMNSDLRALPSPSTSSSSATSGYSSGTPPKQSAWQITGNGGSLQYTNGLFREPDRLENGEKIKRPMNAFMVWSQIRRAQIANQDGKMHNSQISKELGIEWRKMSAEQKAPFIQKVRSSYKRVV
uniref:Sex-determining region Y protein n=1 Tax=Parascaris equorum TaxID=6256 RepID=A0A914RN39_PAREQ